MVISLWLVATIISHGLSSNINRMAISFLEILVAIVCMQTKSEGLDYDAKLA